MQIDTLEIRRLGALPRRNHHRREHARPRERTPAQPSETSHSVPRRNSEVPQFLPVPTGTAPPMLNRFNPSQHCFSKFRSESNSLRVRFFMFDLQSGKFGEHFSRLLTSPPLAAPT